MLSAFPAGIQKSKKETEPENSSSSSWFSSIWSHRLTCSPTWAGPSSRGHKNLGFLRHSSLLASCPPTAHPERQHSPQFNGAQGSHMYRFQILELRKRRPRGIRTLRGNVNSSGTDRPSCLGWQLRPRAQGGLCT